MPYGNITKICFLTLNPELSGQFTSLLSLAASIDQCGRSTFILSPLASGTAQEVFERKGSLPAKKNILRSFQPIAAVLSKAKQFDIIQFHLPSPAFTLLGDPAMQINLDLSSVEVFLPVTLR